MMYPYMTLADETEIVHSQVIEEDGKKKVIVNFERPTEDGFDSARCELPDYKWTEREGYSDEEIAFLKKFYTAMHICYISMLRMGESILPKLFTVSGYTVYFWSNENGEPIHVHVSKGKPTPNATKIWLTRSGGCILASNGSKISNKQLNELMEFISAQFFLICAKWKKAFVTDDIKFYC